MTFTEYINEAVTIEEVFGDKFLPFLDSLTFYVDRNDGQSKTEILPYMKEIKAAGFLTKPKSVYRMVKLEKKRIKQKT